MDELPGEAATDHARRLNDYREALPGRRARGSAFLVKSLCLEDPAQRKKYQGKLLRSWDILTSYETASAEQHSILDAGRKIAEASGKQHDFSKKFYAELDKELGQ